MPISRLTAQRLEKPLYWVLLSFVVLLAPCFARADHGARASIGLGVGISSFSQKDSNHELAFNSLLAGTLGAQVGLRIHYFFIEYAPVLFYHPDNGGAREISYLSYLSGNAGIALPVIPLDFYVGFERGRYSLTYATNGVFGGNALKLGAVANLSTDPKDAVVQIRGEFRRFYGMTDDAGSIPTDVHTNADIFMLSVSFGKR